MMNDKAQIAIIGAGPLGLEIAISLKRSGISYLHFDKGQVAQAIYNFPTGTHFYSYPECISLASIPIQTTDQQKCSREEYLAYVRSIVSYFDLKISTYEEVIAVRKESDTFFIKTRSNQGHKEYQVEFLVIATGSTSKPKKLNVPGEELDHVHEKLKEPHYYFKKKVAIIGGKNSAVEDALRCYQAMAEVTLITRKEHFKENEVKYWLLPELLGRIKRKEMTCYYTSHLIEIRPNQVVFQNKGVKQEIEADFVIKAVGFDANLSLLEKLGVSFRGEQRIPFFNSSTMETNIPHVYVLGTVTGGHQKVYRAFIENTHIHVERILKDLSAKLQTTIIPYFTKLRKPKIPEQ
ncbi:MAG: NAD(P)-binding domain-containing protein [Parachlamydiaceae bacterium]